MWLRDGFAVGHIIQRSNHNISSPFRHVGHFFVFNSFDDAICFRDQQGFVPICIVDQQLILTDFLQSWHTQQQKCAPPSYPKLKGYFFLVALAGLAG